MRTGVRQYFIDPGPVCVVRHDAAPDAPTVVFVTGLGTGMSEPRYLWSILARDLAARGVNAVQYDHPGHADSMLGERPPLLDDLRAAAAAVVAHVPGPVHVVGYGVGAVLAAELTARGAVDSCVLVCPDTAAWAAGSAHLAGRVRVPPEALATHPASRALVDAAVGEPYQPPQPAGAVVPDLLTAAARASGPAFADLRDTCTTVVAASEADTSYARSTGLRCVRIDHEPTASAPSWHWEHGPRAAVADAVIRHVAEGGGTTRPAVPAHVQESVAAPDGSRVSSVAFESDGDRLFGVLHQPPGDGPWPVCLVYEPGNPGQRVDIHECGVLLAHAGAAAGLPAFRYDSRGTGVSEGTFTHSTWARRMDDLRAAVARLRADGVAERFVVVGNSAGARLSVMAAAEPWSAGVVLWGPILAEEDDAGTPARLHRVDGTVAASWCGLWLGVAYQRDDRSRDYLALLRASPMPVCAVFGTEELDVPLMRPVIDEVARHPEWPLVVVDGSHGFSAAGLADAVAATVSWAAALPAPITSGGAP
ncbi:alpha/beta fold hydrolase [Saccharopolyspora sp. 5N708]|uniref:alpha/beta fold hydrolase n=1 Tax=Saccharopolyspora sp. 5N708 TaxID=3457424 RepID=UPI003FD20939